MLSTLARKLTSKASTNDDISAQQEAHRPRFKALTLEHIQKLDNTAQQVLIENGANNIANGNSDTAAVPTIALVNGPRRSTAQRDALDILPTDLQSCAASILSPSALSVSPNTPISSLQSNGPALDRSSRCISQISIIDEEDEDIINDYLNPFEDNTSPRMSSRNIERQEVEKSQDDVRTKNPFLDPIVAESDNHNQKKESPWLPRLDTAFLNSSQHIVSSRPAIEPSRSSSNTQYPQESNIRFSDCGVNPCNFVDEHGKKVRKSDDEVAGLWSLILGKVRDVKHERAQNQRNSNRFSEIDLRPQESIHNDIPIPQTPLPQINFGDDLIDYGQRRASSRYDDPYTPLTMLPSAKPGMSPNELTEAAKLYLARLEAEIEDLMRFKKEKEEEDRMREELKRSGASQKDDHFVGGTDKSPSTKKLSLSVEKKQPKTKSISTDFAAFGTQSTPWSRNGESSTAVEATAYNSSLSDIESEAFCHNDTKAKVTMSPKEEQHLKMVREVDISNKDMKRFSSQSKTRLYGTSLQLNDAEEAKHVLRINTDCDLPPPYTPSPEKTRKQARPPIRNASQPGPSRHSRKNFVSKTRYPEGRFPIRPHHLPKLNTRASALFKNTLHVRNASPAKFVDVAFTPTTPHHSRTGTNQAYQQPAQPHYQLSLADIGFRNKQPHEIRDAAEKKRRRQERRKRIMGRGGWFWLCGLCCGVDRMTRKQKVFWFALSILFIIFATVFGITYEFRKGHKPKPIVINEPTMVTLPNLPSMPTGNVTVTPKLFQTISTCVSPSTLWSCALPPPLSDGFGFDRPVFMWNIMARNGSSQDIVTNPRAPSIRAYRNVSGLDAIRMAPLEGEQTDFLISIVNSNISSISTPTSQSEKRELRIHPRNFPKLNTTFTFGPFTPDSTAAPSVPSSSSAPFVGEAPIPPSRGPAELFPAEYQAQPLRFFNRGLPTEHYGFQVPFNKTIYVRSIAGIDSDVGANPLDQNGGVAMSEARWKCMFPGTRFLVKIWTKPHSRDPDHGGAQKVIVDPNSFAVLSGPNTGGLAGYPVSIEEDRAGIDAGIAHCWKIDERGDIDVNQYKIVLERNGINTGQRGCQCRWDNWKYSTDGK